MRVSFENAYSRPKNCGPPRKAGSWVPPWAEAYLRTKWHPDPSSRLDTTDMDLKWGDCCARLGGSLVPISNTMWPRPRPTCVSSGILIHPTVWPQYTNVTRQTHADKQRCDSIGRTVLQTAKNTSPLLMYNSEFFCRKSPILTYPTCIWRLGWR